MMEEYHPKVVHIAGVDNDASDALSRLPMKEKSFDTIQWQKPNRHLRYSDGTKEDIFVAMTKVMSHNSFEDGDFDETLYPVSTRAQQEVEDRFPLSCKRMQDDQLSDVKLMKTVKKSIDKKEKKYSYKKVEEVKLVHKDGKILVPPAARPRVLDWYHQHLVHPGIQRMYSTIKINYTWLGLFKDCEKYCKS